MIDRHIEHYRRVLALSLVVAAAGWMAFLQTRVEVNALRDRVIDNEVERGASQIHRRHAQRIAGLVRGRVTSLSAITGVFVVDLDAEDALAPGTRLTIRRDDRMVGFARVERVDAGCSMACMLDARQRLDVRVGDEVGLDVGFARR